MKYQEVKCRNCGGIMHITRDAGHIRCPYCDTEYIFKSQRNEESPVRIVNYRGRGALFQSYIPAGWECHVFDDKESISSTAAVCKGLQLFPSDMSARLLFYPFAFYKDSAPKASFLSSMGIPGFSSDSEYQLDPMSLVCHCKWLELPQYAYRRISALTSQLLPDSSRPELSQVQASGDVLQQKAMRQPLRILKNRQMYFPVSSPFASQPVGNFTREFLPLYLHRLQRILPPLLRIGSRIS